MNDFDPTPIRTLIRQLWRDCPSKVVAFILSLPIILLGVFGWILLVTILA